MHRALKKRKGMLSHAAWRCQRLGRVAWGVVACQESKYRQLTVECVRQVRKAEALRYHKRRQELASTITEKQQALDNLQRIVSSMSSMHDMKEVQRCTL